MTVILGIDPGSRKTGFGVVALDGRRPRYVSSGVIRLPAEAALSVRLGVLSESMTELLDTHAPDQLAIEQVFMARSADSALKLGQARGAAMVACVTRGLEVFEYSARQIKQAVVGTGAASKEQVAHMVRTLLRLPGTPQEDAADALGAALCHIHTQQTLSHLVAAGGPSRGRRT